MKRTATNQLIIVSISGLLLVGCATKKSSDENAPTGPPSATLTVKGGSAGYWASGGTGSGTLNYRGQSHPFSVTSVGAGGTGAQSFTGTAEVYNLDRLSDFEGTYTSIRSGLTVIGGKQTAKLTNNEGVVIYAKGTTMGLGTSTGASTVKITLK